MTFGVASYVTVAIAATVDDVPGVGRRRQLPDAQEAADRLRPYLSTRSARTFAAISHCSRLAPRCVTMRSARGPTAETRTPWARAAVTTAAASGTSTTTMFVCTEAGSTPHAPASSRAFSW